MCVFATFDGTTQNRFRTEARAAGHPKTHILSREEREEAELAEMKKVRPCVGVCLCVRLVFVSTLHTLMLCEFVMRLFAPLPKHDGGVGGRFRPAERICVLSTAYTGGWARGPKYIFLTGSTKGLGKKGRSTIKVKH